MKFLQDGRDILPETDEEVSDIFEDEVMYNLYRTYRGLGESVIGAFQRVLEDVANLHTEKSKP